MPAAPKRATVSRRGSKTPNVRTYFQFFKRIMIELVLLVSFNSYGTVGAASSMLLQHVVATLTRIESAPVRLRLEVTLRARI